MSIATLAEQNEQDVFEGYIASEIPKESPEWKACIDGLLKALSSPSQDDGHFKPPSTDVIKSALHFLCEIRERFPFAPPTLIAPDPSGGVIVERTYADQGKNKIVWEVTFFDNRAELLIYKNGKIIDMKEVKK